MSGYCLHDRLRRLSTFEFSFICDLSPLRNQPPIQNIAKLMQFAATKRLQMNWISGDRHPSGNVPLRGHLLADGQLGAVEILKTNGRREFDQAAVMALRNARSNSHLVDGKAVEPTA